MSTPHEQISQPAQESEPIQIVETPMRYPLELLEATFDQIDIITADEYQLGRLEAGSHSLLVQPLPESFTTKYRRELPLLTFNATIYTPEIEKALKKDPVLEALGKSENTYERARAICARRSVLMLKSPGSAAVEKDA